MGVMAADKIRSLVDGKTSQRHLIGVGNFLFFVAPVENHDHKLRAFFFYSGDILFQLFCPFKMVVQFVNSDQTYFDAFYIHDLGFIITKMDDPLVVQRLHSICKALFAVIMAVVIGCVHRLNISRAQNRREFRGSFERELFILPFLRVGEGSLEIGNGKIVCGENAFYVGKEIVRTVAFVISVQAGVVVEILVSAESTVANHADRQRNGFCRKGGSLLGLYAAGFVLRLGTVIFGSFFAGYGAFPAVLCSSLCVLPVRGGRAAFCPAACPGAKDNYEKQENRAGDAKCGDHFFAAVPVITGFFVYVFSVSVSGLSCVF